MDRPGQLAPLALPGGSPLATKPGHVERLSATAIAARVPRNELFAALLVIGTLNGAAGRVIYRLTNESWPTIWLLLELNAVVFLATLAAIHQLYRMPAVAPGRRDLAVVGLTLALIVFPSSPASWLGLTFMGLYLGVTGEPGSRQRRGGWIVAALTVPMLWSRVLMSVLGDFILRLDALAVSLLLTTERNGNAIAFADGWGYFWIAPECSSLGNVSLAILAWVAVAQSVEDRQRPQPFFFLVLIGSVIALNVGRMVVTGLARDNHSIIHGQTGNLVFGWLFLATIAAIIFIGCRAGAARSNRSRMGASPA